MKPQERWAARPGVGSRTQGQLAGRERVPPQSCVRPRGAAGAPPGKTSTRTRRGRLYPRGGKHSLLCKPGALSFATIPAFSAVFCSPQARVLLHDAGSWLKYGERNQKKKKKNTRVFQAPSRFTKSHRPPRRRTTQQGLHYPDSCLDGRAEGNGVSRSQARC